MMDRIQVPCSCEGMTCEENHTLEVEVFTIQRSCCSAQFLHVQQEAFEHGVANLIWFMC